LTDKVCKNGNEDKQVQDSPIYYLLVLFFLFALESFTKSRCWLIILSLQFYWKLIKIIRFLIQSFRFLPGVCKLPNYILKAVVDFLFSLVVKKPSNKGSDKAKCWRKSGEWNL